ncbi:MCE family protein [Nocardia bovistercoris]|uniref:MCE family protein n=1 Tax=Nocardia bovistercoris TaxID=2785916 RepID=A0A931I9D4_9NOCA|nr:MlaD family protein [Nocardia bovistercoris]MBH0776308.1 MCE family protein [Nocardia bovistercoris]
MSYWRSAVGLALFLVVAVVLTWMVGTTLQRGVPGRTHSYSALFTDVSGLRVGDDVRMAGVQVGRVDGIDIEGTAARVTFEVQRNQTLYGNTRAAITYQNLIGQRYLGLSLAELDSPQPLPPGAQIPLERTEPSFDLSMLLNGFQPLFGLLDPADVDDITAALIRALQGEDSAIPALIARTATLVESFAAPDQILGSMIDNLSQVVGNLSRQGGQLQTTIAQTRKIFDGLHERRDALLDQTTDIAAVVGRAAQVVQGAAPALNRFLERDNGFSRHFVENRESFAYLGFNLAPLMHGMSRIVDQGAYLTAYICDIGLSMIPGIDPLIAAILGIASPSGKPEHSPVCR